jgi:two-component system response regulator protein BraR/BceR
MTIVIIEDDKKLRQELKILLENNNYKVTIIEDFKEAVVDQIKNIDKDLILLDINLPNQNGFDICKKIKEQESVPIIFVTSSRKEEDELKSIISGGEDFITKPYNKDILLEKIKRTIKQKNPIQYKEIKVKDVTLDLHLSIVKYQDKSVELTRNEFLLLYYFFTHPQKIITKEELLDYLWNEKYYLDDNILTVNINRLRKKLEEINQPDFIKTIRKQGYKIE